MKKQNNNFICEICGKPDMVALQITIDANYGSLNDGTRLTLHVCGDCIDKIISQIVDGKKGECYEQRLSNLY